MTFDLSKHKEAYLSEARSHLKIMNQALVSLEKDHNNPKLLHEIFRSVHTFKSLSATMRYEQSKNLCHAIEDVLDSVRHNQLPLEICIDLLFEGIDQLTLIIKALSANEQEQDTSSLVKKFENLLLNNKNGEQANPANLVQLEMDAIEKIQSIEVKIEQLDSLMNITEEFLENKMRLEAIREQVDHPELPPAIESLGRLITDLQYHMMQVRLVPIAFVFNRFIRMTRDLAKQQNKKVDLQIEGADIEFDRSLINEVAEAITHLIRNAIDHGLETPEVRKAQNKPETGTILLKVFRTKEAARIEVSDDGAGINLEEVKQTAQKNNLLKPGDSEITILEKIFTGISTAKTVTEISGRGLGLPIVKLKIESIGGSITVKSTPGQGTTFIIEIPLTLAIIKTLLVKSGPQTYAIPTDFVERLLMTESVAIKGYMNDEALIYEDNSIPIIRINHLFSNQESSSSKQPIIIIQKGNKRVGIVVDELLTTKDIITKPLNRSIKDNRYFSGATLIGSGQLVLILDVAYLLQLRNKSASIEGGLVNAI